MTATISVANWDDFQHYRDRDPPWIKLYRDILTSEPWLFGTDCSRLVQIAIILLAARYKNDIPANPALIRKAGGLDYLDEQIAEALEKLLSLKFIKIHGLDSKLNGKASHVLATCSSEEERSEQERARESRSELELELETSPSDAGGVHAVFAHWQKAWQKQRAKLDPKRHKLIKLALKSFDVATLCESITGYRKSAYHMGKNDRNTVYDDIGLFLRDAAHIEAGLNHARGSAIDINGGRRRAKTVAELEAEEHAKH